MAKPSDKKTKNKIKVDFTGVEARVSVPDGDYHVAVKETSLEKGDAAQYIKWVFSVKSDDKLNNAQLYYNTSLAPQALWNLRNLLATLGVDTPDGAMDLDFDELVGLECMVHVEGEVYEGKTRPKITDFQPLTEVAETSDEPETSGEEEEETEEAEEEEVEEGEEEEGKITADQVRELDEAGIKALIKEHKLKVDITGLEKKPKKRASMVIEALEKADLLGE